MNPIHRCLCHYPFIPVCDKAAVSDFAALTLTVFTLFTSNISPNKKVHRCSLPRKDGVVYIIYPLNNVYSISSLFNSKDLIIIICIISLLRKKFLIIDRFRSLINDLSKFGVIDLHQGSNNSSLFSTY